MSPLGREEKPWLIPEKLDPGKLLATICNLQEGEQIPSCLLSPTVYWARHDSYPGQPHSSHCHGHRHWIQEKQHPSTWAETNSPNLPHDQGALLHPSGPPTLIWKMGSIIIASSWEGCCRENMNHLAQSLPRLHAKQMLAIITNSLLITVTEGRIFKG